MLIDFLVGIVYLVREDFDFWLQEEVIWAEGLVEVEILRWAF